MGIKEINKKIKEIPPSLIPEVSDYIDFLIDKYKIQNKEDKPFDFLWEGGLTDISDKFNSTQLQHKALDWR